MYSPLFITTSSQRSTRFSIPPLLKSPEKKSAAFVALEPSLKGGIENAHLS